jgi:hypothetical protein
LVALAACRDNSPVGESNDATLAVRVAQGAGSLQFTRPPSVRPWDTSATALAQQIELGGGVAHVAIKETGAPRSLGTGLRSAVSRGTIDAGIALLRSRGATILNVYPDIASVRVKIDGATAAALFGHPLIDFIEPPQLWHLNSASGVKPRAGF